MMITRSTQVNRVVEFQNVPYLIKCYLIQEYVIHIIIPTAIEYSLFKSSFLLAPSFTVHVYAYLFIFLEYISPVYSMCLI